MIVHQNETGKTLNVNSNEKKVENKNNFNVNILCSAIYLLNMAVKKRK